MSEITDSLLHKMKVIVEDVEKSRLAMKNCQNAIDRKKYKWFVESELHEEQSVYCALRKSLRREAKKVGELMESEIRKLDKRIHTIKTEYYPSITLGNHASSFVRWASQEHGTIEFKDISVGMLEIPKKAEKAWSVLRRLLETTAADGYVELDQGWAGLFSRGDKSSDLEHIARHIIPKQRGHTGKGLFRLEEKEKYYNEPV